MFLLRRAALALLTTTILAAPVAACGSHDDDGMQEPTEWGPTYAGQVYCGYVNTPLECTGKPGVPVQFPAAQPLASDLLAMAVWVHLLTYPGFYHSGFYYDRYLAPTHVVVIDRAAYVNTGRDFDRRFAADEKRYTSKAKFNTAKTKVGDKYSGGNTGVVTRKTPGGGGNAGQVPDPGKKPAVGKPAAPKPVAPAPAPVRRK